MKHPLYELFHPLVKAKRVEHKGICPLSQKNISHTSSMSTEYKKMGCLILAGGEATRLKAKAPKGCVELPLKNKKTLFQILFERVRRKGTNLPVAIMTSPLNHKKSVTFLDNHDYFGLTHVELFQQDMVPVCDDQGLVVFDDRGEMVQSPDGNGRALLHLYYSGIWGKWQKRGVEVVQIIPIDNILAQPFDSELLAQHHTGHFDLVLRVIKRENPAEQLGVVGTKDGRITVCEYSELSAHMRTTDFIYGNSGVFTCTLDFVKTTLHCKLPWHLVRKQIPLHENSKKMWVWKFETFIFDLFPFAKDFTTIVGKRQHCFAPIKNFCGPDSIESASRALINLFSK